MRPTDEQTAVVRAYLRGDEDTERRLDRLPPNEAYGFAALITAAFVEALDRRFPESWSPGEVVRFVASARARIATRTYDIDPRRAETLVRATLGDGDPAALDDETKALQAHLLLASIQDEDLDDEALDAFLADARVRAEGILSEDVPSEGVPSD